MTTLGRSIVGLLCSLVASAALSAPVPADPHKIEVIEDILRKGGAESGILEDFAHRLRYAPNTDLDDFRHSLEQMPPEKLQAFVENLRLNGKYRPGPDSIEQPGVPNGETFEFIFDSSKIFPGSMRRITVHVPRQYTGEAPACVYVGLDGLNFEAQTVFDNLIFKHEMPITIAIGIAAGTVESNFPPQNPRFNRSLEFDGMNGDLGRFLLEEVFPEVSRHHTADGRAIRLSERADDRAAGGGSTGGIGSFTLAWEHPEAFRRVFSSIGTYVGMRGGDQYAVLVRKTEPKPIRIFIQDGSHDELTDFLGEMGDWWLSNQTMLSALEFAGYDVKHVFGEGSHDGSQATAVFPDAMRFLWKDWPQGIEAGRSQNVMLNAVSAADDRWQPTIEAPTELPKLSDSPGGYRAEDGQGRAFETKTATGEVWVIETNGRRRLIDGKIDRPTGIAVSPDNLWLAVAESGSHFGYSYRLRGDGSVDARQRYYWFHVPDSLEASGAANWIFDRGGHLFAATAMGVQIFDRNGRSRAILPLPDGGSARAVAFGGKDLRTLYVRSGRHHIYQRRMKIGGIADSSRPIVVPKVSPG